MDNCTETPQPAWSVGDRLAKLVASGEWLLKDGRCGGRPVRSSAAMTEPAGFGGPGYSQVLPRKPESVRAARLLVTPALRDWSLGDKHDAACLVASELLSNAVLHTTEATVQLTVKRMGRCRVRITVADRSSRMPELLDAGPRAEHGRGLALVDAVSDGRWGVDPMTVGKRVWAELAVQALEEGDDRAPA